MNDSIKLLRTIVAEGMRVGGPDLYEITISGDPLTVDLRGLNKYDIPATFTGIALRPRQALTALGQTRSGVGIEAVRRAFG